MLRRFSPLLLPLAAASLSAQSPVQFLYTNISDSTGTTARAYSDAIVLWDASSQRPLAQESHGRTATGSVRKMKVRSLLGRPNVVWYDIITDDVMRGADLNGNGVIDPTEMVQMYDFPASQDGSIDERNGTWWVGMGNVTSATLIGQVWRFQDLDNNGDFKGTGESTLVVPGPTVNLTTPPVTGVSTNAITGIGVMQNGDAIYHPKGTGTSISNAWIRTTAAGVNSLYLCYKAGSPVLPVNPDFGTAIPAIGTNPVDRIAVDPANDTVYIAVNFTVAAPQPFVIRCKDRNANGDANDAGECNMFYDGTTGPVPMTSIDDIEFFNGRIFVSHEAGAPAGPNEFVELVDLNNDGDAMDAGEQIVHGRTSASPLDDPTVIGITVCPTGTFGTSCVNTDLRDNGMVNAGGNLTLTFADIPVANQTPTTIGIGLLSISGDFGIPLPGGCIIGLLPDTLTVSVLPSLITAAPTGRSVSTTPLPYPAGLQGGVFYAAGVTLDLLTVSFSGITHSNKITVQ